MKSKSWKKNSVKFYGYYDKIVEKTIVMEKCDDNLENFIKEKGKSFSIEEKKNIYRY